MVFPDNLGARKVPSASGAKRIWRDRAIPGGIKLDKFHPRDPLYMGANYMGTVE